MATSPYQYYNQILSNWSTAIAPQSQFFAVINFTNVSVIRNNFNNINNYDNPSASGNASSVYWNLPNTTVQNLISPINQLGTDNLIGCVFLRDVSIPNDSVDAGNYGLEYGGYQAPATANVRNKYKKFSMTFNETNSSFIDFIIRPWVVNVGYFGLIARDSGERKVKADFVDIVYLARTGPLTTSIPRKIFRFFNVAPVSVQGMQNRYQSEDLQYSMVDFVYDNYSVLEPPAVGVLGSR